MVFEHAPLPQYPVKMSEGWHRVQRVEDGSVHDVFGGGTTGGHKEL